MTPTVAIVEDDADIVLMLRYALESYGFAAVAISPAAALDPLSYPPEASVALVDVSLGSLSGIDVCGMLREHRSDMRLVVLSAFDERPVEGHPYDEYLVKPAPIELIVDALRAGG